MNKFTQKAQNALNAAMRTAIEMGHSYIGSEHLLLGLTEDTECVSAKFLIGAGADYMLIKSKVAEISGVGIPSDLSPSDMTPRVRKIIESSAIEAVKYSKGYIGTEHLLLALVSTPECVASKILNSFGISVSGLKADIISFLETNSAKDSYDKSRTSSASGESGNAKIANAPTLSNYGRDLTAQARNGSIDPIIGRNEETERLIRTLSRRTKNNPCLIGEPGVGKTAVVEGLALRIAEGNIPETLKSKIIVTLDIPGMIAGAKYRGEFEDRLKTIMNEVMRDPDIILFIDEIHTIIGAGAAEGAVDAANIIKPSLARGEIQVIGATTITEYRKYIEKDAALERRFQPLTVGEPSEEEALAILFGLRSRYEDHHSLRISDEAVTAAVKLSSRYITDRFLPDKAIDLIDEASAKLKLSLFTYPPEIKELEDNIKALEKEKEDAILMQDFESAAKLRDRITETQQSYDELRDKWDKKSNEEYLTVTENDIAEIVTQWTGIPVSRLVEEESIRLLNLEEELKNQVIGQDEAVRAVASAIKRGRTGLKDPSRPMGSFIFSGQTGIGKTELSKALARELFGKESALIRLDMSEYMEKQSVSKLIGSPPGYVGFEDGGRLTELVKRAPYSVVLFDEIEKAHPDIFNILLQILDDGRLTDSRGRVTDFHNTIIIMTSNAGADEIEKTGILGFSQETESNDKKNRSRDTMIKALKRIFKPELINRVDEIVVFSPLGKDDIKKISQIMLSSLTERLTALGIEMKLDDSAVELVSDKGYDKKYGARALRRTIERLIEDPISDLILKREILQGECLSVSANDGNVVFKNLTRNTEL